MCSLVLPFEGVAAGVESVTTQGHVDLVAVAAVPRYDVLQAVVTGARDPPEDQERRVERGIEPRRRGAVGGLAPQRLLRRVDGEAVGLLEHLVEGSAEVLSVQPREEGLGVPAVLEGDRLPVREADAVE